MAEQVSAVVVVAQSLAANRAILGGPAAVGGWGAAELLELVELAAAAAVPAGGLSSAVGSCSVLVGGIVVGTISRGCGSAGSSCNGTARNGTACRRDRAGKD